MDPSLQCRRFWWSIEWFAAILDSLQTGRIGARMTECRRGGGRGREKKTGFFFPLPLPQFFFLSPSLGKLFTSPQLSTISRWRPEQPMEIYIHSPHQNPPALQARWILTRFFFFFNSVVIQVKIWLPSC